MYNQINISSGHSVNCQGAVDIINEVTEAKRVVDRVYEICKSLGIEVYKYHDTASNSSQNLANIVNWHNKFKDGIDVSVHFNAYTHTNNAMGTEVCYYSQSELAANVSKAISGAGGFKNRGAKRRTGLYFLKHTNKPAILIEVCFVDSVKDVELYYKNFDAICNAIVKALTGKSLDVHHKVQGWKQDSKGWLYQLSDKSYPKDKWLQIDGFWYYFGSDGYAYHDRWIEYKGDKYYLGSDCKMLTSGIIDGLTIGKDGKAYKEEIKNEAPVESIKHLIISEPTASKEQMLSWIKLKSEKCLIPASLLWDMSLQYGIDPVVTISQFCWETDFIYRNNVSNAGLNETYHNPCGLKITTGGSDTDSNAHMKFPTWCHGFTAYLDHLALYVGIEGYPSNITLDPRHFPYLKGTVKYVEDLSGKWCPNKGYADNIIKYMNEIKSWQ